VAPERAVLQIHGGGQHDRIALMTDNAGKDEEMQPVMTTDR